ncbi:bifunctional DNA-formamidopyrimidine glycosylase/DNA-(apurinic or apyrimidinic site) lyase [Conexibacter sp. DBS9H8]|uniref:bifunctional DNA-formamidopyrimidine glycosylase/DNA-(apurinic or apyrimidinic site) lyase n=1 Tax=Conexibacter sp. DBS9H8 TaxID=2937801 RepID=UPI00200D359E|nr:bifunctional DNA-formamidopyrimidine glycosylase/DNA-(apurinic or apyrimidinic site) lyase [Conexibacter sp. DBS9H8]
MPELPEVETIRRQLAPQLIGATLTRVEILDPRWTRPVDPKPVSKALTGAVVVSLDRAGKYLIWGLDGDRQLLMHLRMSGALLWSPVPEPIHTRVRFSLDSGQRVCFTDPRRFGTGQLFGSRIDLDAHLAARLGPEPLTPAFSAAVLARRARGRSAPVKAFILDQREIAGVGNIYADESLFRARIHPLTPVGALSASRWKALATAIEAALALGIDAKGASIDDFRHVDGQRGSFQDSFLVYGRTGQPCPVCGTPISKLVVGGRGTHICERCQRRPRRLRR